jgi:pyruvate dehydrogenase E2 component (dihydrolipoamide acetyltransferase)
MPIEVRLPDLGDAITHARLTTWLKQAGDRIDAGEAIAEVETDKTNVEIEAPGSGTLLHIHVAEGTDDVAVNTLLAVIGEAQAVEAAPAVAADRASPPAVSGDGGETGAGFSANADERADAASLGSRRTDLSAAGGGPKDGAGGISSVEGTSTERDTPMPDDHIDASPLARRMADAAGISLAAIVGTGPGGRITKRDVDGVLGPPVAELGQIPEPADRPPVGVVQGYEEPPMSPMRRITAERLTHAKQTIPHFYLQTDCHVDAVSAMRAELNARREVKLSLTAFAIRAAALALLRVPAANSSWIDGVVRVYSSADLAIAVETPSGLIAPVIRGAERKSLSSLNEELRTLADRARTGRLKPHDYSGGTFTISNLGMHGVSGIFPIINPPQTCILGLGAVEQRAIVRDNAVTVGTVMTCTLSADHRAVDGATGARFLAAFRGLLEDPWALVL